MSASRNKSIVKNTDDVEFLLKTNEEQNDQITRLQTKFRDVTNAYRSLLEEKKALEITVKALRTTSKSSLAKLTDSNRTKQGSRSDLNTILQTSSRTTSVSDLSEIETHSNTDSVDLDSSNPKSVLSNLVEQGLNQEEKINALTSNIQLLIDSKSKLERGFQAERKKFIIDSDELKARLENFKADTEKKNDTYELRIKELRISFKQSQSEREKLTNDLNVLIKSKSAEQENKILNMQEENQSILLNLRNENNNLKQKFKNMVKQFENKCEEVIQCEKDTQELKLTHSEQIRKKEDMLVDIRERLQHSQNSSELRIRNLESKINELCLIISKYENGDECLRSNNNSNMTTNYVNKLNSNKYIDEEVKDDLKKKSIQIETADLDFDSAIEQMQNLKNYIEISAKELNINFNFNEIWGNNGNSNLEREKNEITKLNANISKLKEENRHLKEEYEKYKIRTNYLIKSAKQSTKEISSNNELELQHKQIIQKYKDEIDILNKRIHLAARDKNSEIISLNEKFEEKISMSRNEFKNQFDKLEHERVKNIDELEKELVKQRERTIKLLNEKENELDTIKGNYYRTSPGNKQRAMSPKKIEQSFSESTSIQKQSETELHLNTIDMNKSLTHFSETNKDEENEILGVPTENNRIIHFSQEAAYKDTELNKLRNFKVDLEYKLKRNNDEHTVDIDRYQTQINVLKQEIERLKLNEDRSDLNNANLEYVKNVIFNFMTTKDNNVKLSMQNALTQILKFTKVERQKLNSSSIY